MVYRYESDKDAFLEYPEPGSDLSVLGAGAPPPAGPSRSRFPTPSLPPPARATRPAVDPVPTTNLARPAVAPGPARAVVPAPQPVPPAAPRTPGPEPEVTEPATGGRVYGTTPPVDRPGSRHGDRNRGGRAWQVLIGGTCVLVLLALCGLGAALLQDQAAAPQAAEPTSQPGVEQSAAADGHGLDSRDTDPLALTAKEVFPGNQLVVTEGQPAYPVLKTHSSGSCAVAAAGEVADLLVRLGCNQVVRATLRSPDGGHLLTAGLFNLTDVASAQRVRDRIRQLLDERQGRLLGMAVGDDTAAVARAAARVGWQVRGHYLAYCVVTRADGQRIGADDPKAREILYDMIELHLNREVLERRANSGVASQPAAPADGTQDGAGDPPGN